MKLHFALSSSSTFLCALKRLRTMMAVVCMLVVSNYTYATVYYSNNANPTVTSNWWTNTNGTGSNPGNFTTSGDIFIIQSGQTCSTNGSWVIAAGVTLQIDGTLAISGNNNAVTINGTVIFTSTNATQVTLAGAGSGNDFILGATGVLKTANVNGIQGTNCSLPANASKRTITLNTAADYEFNGTSDQLTLGMPTLASGGTLTISNTSGTVTAAAAYTFASGSITTINSSATFGTGAFAFTNNGTTNVNGSFEIDQSGTVAGANFTYGASGTLVFAHTSGTYGINSTSVFWPSTNGPANVTVVSNAINFGNGGTAMSRTVSGIFQTAAAVSITQSSGSSVLTISGTCRINTGGSFSNTPTYSGTSSTLVYNTGGSFTNGNEWNSTSATVGLGVPQNVTIQNNTTLTTAANRALTGTLTVASGATIALGAGYTAGTSSIAGTLRLNSGGSVTPTITYSGTASTLVYNNTGSVSTGAEWNSTSATVGAGVPQNVTIQNNTTVTTAANRALTGTLTVASGATIALGAGYTAGSSSIAGTLRLNSGGSVTPTITYSGTASTLVYNNTGSVSTGAEWNSTSATVGAGVPQNVTVQNNTTLTTAANRALTGTLTVASGATIALGAGYTAGASSIAGTLRLNSGGSVTPTITYSGTASTLVYNNSGSVSTGAEWNSTSATVGAGVPQNVTVQNNTTVTTAANRALTGTLTVASGATIALGAAYTAGASSIAGTLQLNSGGSVTPTITYSGTASNLVYNNSGSVSTGAEWNSTSATVGAGVPQNVTIQNNTTVTTSANRALTGTLSVASGATLGVGGTFTASTSSIDGQLQLNAGGSIITNSPVYSSTSTLIYNQTGTVTPGLEWTGNSNTAGIGIPQNIIVENGTTLNMPGADRGVPGDITILTGNLTLNPSGDIYVGGKWKRPSNSNVNYNNKKVIFNGGSDQTIEISDGGTESFNSLVIDKPNGKVKLSNSPATSLTISGNTGNILEIKNAGQFDLNGQTLTMNGNGGNIYANGGNRTITATGGGVININGNKTFTGGNTTIDDGITLNVAADVDFGTGNLGRINGTLQLNNGGTVSSNAPVFGTNSNLIYNQGGTNNTGMEWSGNGTTPGIGIPKNITIQNGTTISLTSGNKGVAGDLNISNGTLNLNATSGDLYVAGNWTRTSSGNFNHNSRKVIFNGTGKTVINAPSSSSRNVYGGFGGEVFHKISVNKTNTSDSVRLASNITVINQIEFTKGAFDCNKSDVTLVSNDLGTANVAAITNTSNVSINYTDTGKFIVQRHIPIEPWSSSRRWRLMAAPVSNSSTNDITINRAWQEGSKNATLNSPVNPQPGYGTTITNGNTAAAVTNGFDLGNTSSPSIYYMSPGPSPTWVAPSSTYIPISSHEGYMLFVRGHRGVTISNQFATPDSTTLEPKGRLNIGDVTKSIVAGVQVIGNPYASAISFNNVSYNGINPGSIDGIGLTYYLWDPKSPGAYNVGQWITFSSNGDGTYTYSPTPVSSFSDEGIIESGAAFVINSDNPGTLVIHESDKVTGSSTIGIASKPGKRPAAVTVPKLSLNMYLKNSDGTKSMMDGVTTLYGESFRDIVDGQDALKISTFTSKERVGLIRNGSMLSIERRKTYDTSYITINKLNTDNHQLEFIPENWDMTQEIILEDKFKNTYVVIDPSAKTYYDFNINGGAAASDTARFRISFRTSTTLPVRISSVNAGLSNNTVTVNWKVETETNVKSYEVERSTDGIHFNKLSAIANIANNGTAALYSIKDNDINNNEQYYRIKIITQSGSIIYSQVVKVRMNNTTSGISIFPNPIKNNTLNIQLNNMTKGTYAVKVNSAKGQNVYSYSMTINATSQTESVILPGTISKGNYFVEFTSPDNEKTVKQISVQ